LRILAGAIAKNRSSLACIHAGGRLRTMNDGQRYVHYAAGRSRSLRGSRIRPRPSGSAPGIYADDAGCFGLRPKKHPPRPTAACAGRSIYLHRTRPQRSRQHQRQCMRPQRSRQHRRHEACATSLKSAVIPAPSGEIGAAGALPGIATKSNPANAIAKPIRNMIRLRFSSSSKNPVLDICSGLPRKDGATAGRQRVEDTNYRRS
jgi:hypothetical protein